jgi:hypothetical protein
VTRTGRPQRIGPREASGGVPAADVRPPTRAHAVDVTCALLSGVIGGLLMSIVLASARLAGMRVNFALLFGTLIAPIQGTFPWFIGIAAHFILSAVFALAYAWSFEHITHRSGARWGAAFGLVHAVMAGLVIGAFPAVSWTGRTVPSPGWFMANLGAAGVLVELGAHLIYGTTVGTMYDQLRR